MQNSIRHITWFYFLIFFQSGSFDYLRDESRRKVSFMENMIEDRTESALSYYEFLLHLQQQISKWSSVGLWRWRNIEVWMRLKGSQSVSVIVHLSEETLVNWTDLKVQIQPRVYRELNSLFAFLTLFTHLNQCIEDDCVCDWLNLFMFIFIE